MGRNKIGSILTQSRKLYSFKGKKVANHSVRKTSLGQLLDSNVAETFVAQHAGMKSIDSLKSYKSPGVMKISEMSDVLTGVKRDIIVAKENTIISKQNPVSSDIDFSWSQSSSTSSISKRYLTGNDFRNCQNCTFNFNVNTGEPPRKRRIILSSDEEN